MSDQSEVGIVLASAPRLERAFGRKLAAAITFAGLYYARRPAGTLDLGACLSFVLALALQTWIRLRASIVLTPMIAEAMRADWTPPTANSLSSVPQVESLITCRAILYR